MRYIKYIADRCSYNDDGTLVWVHLDRRFTLEMDAAKAYNTAALDYFGNFANLNEIAYEYMD